jgi:hypothetical protein
MTWKIGAKVTLWGLWFIYILTGFLHLVWFDYTVSRVHCFESKGLIYASCNTGKELASTIVFLGWPYYYVGPS